MAQSRKDPEISLDLNLDLDAEVPGTNPTPHGADSDAPMPAAGASGAPADAHAGRLVGAGAAAAGEEAPPVPPRPGLLRRALNRLRAEDSRAPAASRCVIMGPSASGKTLLLMSLDRCVDAQGHSYAGRYTATIGDKNRDFNTLEGWLDRYLPRGLLLDASDLGTCFQPAFTLRITDESGRRKRLHDTRFETFDGAGGLMVEDLANTDTRFQRCREMLETALAGCDAVLICLPILQRVQMTQEKALKEYLHRFMDHRGVRHLVVCFTMYEKLGAGLGRHAWHTLANRGFARAQMAAALRGHLAAIDNVLKQFQVREDSRKVWCVPVSTYGFVPGNGGANLAVIRREAGGRIIDDQVLRTRPRAPGSGTMPDLERPYEEEAVRQYYWQPFLTLDPFIFIATGFTDRRGTLIHGYDELWR